MQRTSSTILVLAAAALAVALLCAGPAAAACPINDPDCLPGPVITTKTITHTLTVTRSAGTITSSPAGISCGSVCTVDDSQDVTCRDGACSAPDPDGWTTFTLTASGGSPGFTPTWTHCTVQPDLTCKVTTSADRSVDLRWQDVQDPSVTLQTPAANAKVGSVMTVTATASDNDRIAEVRFFVDGVLKATDAAAPYAATIATSGYADGSTHSVSARAIDPAGRIAEVSHSGVTVDRHVGLTVGDVPAFTNAAPVPLAVSTDPDASMKCSVSGAATAAPASCAGAFSPVTAAFPDGNYAYKVVATDGVGNTASATRSFVLDRTVPAIGSFDGPAEGGEVTTGAVTMSFSVADDNLATIQCVLDARPHACTSPTTDALSGLAPGTHQFALIATDKAANRTTRTRTFSVKSRSTPAPTPISTTTAKRHLERNPARLIYGYALLGKSTRLPLLVVRHAARRSTITVRCKGRGCPKGRQVFTARRSTVKLTSLQKRAFRAGAVLTIRVAKAGMKTKTVRITIRKGKRPKVR